MRQLQRQAQVQRVQLVCGGSVETARGGERERLCAEVRREWESEKVCVRECGGVCAGMWSK